MEIIVAIFVVIVLLFASRRFRRRTRYWRQDFDQRRPRWDAEYKARDNRVASPKPDYADPAEQLADCQQYRLHRETGHVRRRVQRLQDRRAGSGCRARRPPG